jgi:hypothetical protein
MFTARPSTDLNVHLCQVLWEVLALNIVHCELVTREEGPLKVDFASSSSSSSTVQPQDQQTWGGRSAHWIALQELGKLAMFISEVPYAGNQGNKIDYSLVDFSDTEFTELYQRASSQVREVE